MCGACGAAWSSTAAYDRECIARGLDTSKKRALDRELDKTYISDGTFHEELVELTELIKHNTYVEMQKNLEMAVSGRVAHLLGELTVTERAELKSEIRALNSMLGWVNARVKETEK